MNSVRQHWAKAGLAAALLTGAVCSVSLAQDTNQGSAGQGNGTPDNTTQTAPGGTSSGTGTTDSTAAKTTPPVAARFKQKVPPGTRGGSPTQQPFDEMAVNDNAAMLIRTLAEEKGEIQQLTAQQAAFRKMGGRTNLRIASMFGRWIREHKAAGPQLMALIHRNGGDPQLAVVRKAPVLGSAMQMLHATHQDHVTAVVNSQSRWSHSQSPAVKAFMHKRANLAKKHIRQMMPFMKMPMHS
ncbi:MAG: hypothetical protein JO316_22015 [Abitibacteriaceae bacterium]|nr:hypothetical protein [Abditibacteriaceae bacterium]